VLGLQVPHMVGCGFHQPTLKLFGQANADHPTPGALHQGKASDDRSKGDPDNQGNGGNGDGHGDTTSNRPGKQ
jgi:hypothetical protein